MSKNDDMIKLVRLFEGTQFAGEPEQKPGDQVRGTDKAVVKGKQHPFHNRLVGEEISLEDKLSKRYQDMKDVQAKEKEQKKKEESDKQDVSEASGYDGSEPLDLSTNPSVNDVFKRALYIYDYEGYGNDMDYSEDDAIDQYVARKFGQDVLDKLTHARNQQYFGRADGKGPGGGGRTSNLGTSSALGGDFRTTKAGKMHGQDAKMMKARVADRLGRHPEPNLPEGMLGNPGEQDSPVSQAITRRILLQRTDLLSKYGPAKVMAAIDEVADFVGDVDEIGSSDVSGWIRHVEQMLGNMNEQGMAEGWNDDDDFFARADHSGKSGVAVDRSVPGRTIGRLSNRPRDSEKPEKPFRPSNTKDTGRTTGHRSSAVQPRFGYDSANPGYSRARFGEGENPADKITLDVPLMIRIMEYAREDAKDDVDLHNVAEQLVRLSSMGKTLGMNDYDGIVGMTTEQKLSELGAVPPTPPTPPQGTATGNTTPTSGSVSPDEQTALNKIQTNPAMKQQFDKLMTQATPGTANKPAVLDPQQQDALEKIKTNAGLKGQYDRLIKQANPTATP